MALRSTDTWKQDLKSPQIRHVLTWTSIYQFLQTSYWAKGRRRGVVERAIKNSLCFGAYRMDVRSHLLASVLTGPFLRT